MEVQMSAHIVVVCQSLTDFNALINKVQTGAITGAVMTAQNEGQLSVEFDTQTLATIN